MTNKDYINATIRELASTDGHLIIDGGAVVKHDGNTLVVHGKGWNLAIEEDAIASSPYGYLLPPTNEARAEDKPFKLTAPKPKKAKGKKNKSRKPRGKTTAGRILEVKKLKSIGESLKRITARTGLSSSTIVRICNGGLDHKLSKKQRAIILPERTKRTKTRGKRKALNPIKLAQVESYIRNNPDATSPVLEKQFDISSGTAWRIKNNQHALQLKRK